MLQEDANFGPQRPSASGLTLGQRRKRVISPSKRSMTLCCCEELGAPSCALRGGLLGYPKVFQLKLQMTT